MAEKNYQMDEDSITHIGRPRFFEIVPTNGPVEKQAPPLATRKSVLASLYSIYGDDLDIEALAKLLDERGIKD